MTHKELKLWSEKQDWSIPHQQIADREGVPYPTIAMRWNKYRRAHGLPKKKRGRPIMVDPSTIDFTLQDTELADIHGISRERCRQLRKAAGAPRSPNYRRHKRKSVQP